MYANPVNDIITLLDHELVQLFITSPARSQLNKLTDSRTDVMLQRTCHVSLFLLHLPEVLICNLFVYNNRMPLKHAHSNGPSQLGLSPLLRNVLILLLKWVSCPEGSLHRKHERKCWVKAGPQTSELQRRVAQLPENVSRLFSNISWEFDRLGYSRLVGRHHGTETEPDLLRMAGRTLVVLLACRELLEPQPADSNHTQHDGS